MLIAILVILALIFVNAFYVAAEFSSVGMRKSRVRQLAERGNPRARRLLPFAEDPVQLDRYIAASQIGITWSSLVVGAFSQSTVTPQLAPWLAARLQLDPQTALTVTTIGTLTVLTSLQVVFAELVPKCMALENPTRLALWTVIPMRWSLTAYSWFLNLLNGSGTALVRLFGVREPGHTHLHSADEIGLLFAESSKGGLIRPDELRRLRRALRLSAWPVRQFMVPRAHMAAIDADAPPDKILELFARYPFTRYPVYEGSTDNVVGLVHARDIVYGYVRDGRIPRPRDVIRPIASIAGTATADSLLSLFRERRTHQAIVVDEFGVVGLTVLGDVLMELFGDEAHGQSEAQPERLPDGRIRLPGLLRIKDTQEWLGDAWRGRANTVGGHIVQELARFPKAGERLTISGIEVEIESVARHTITSVLVWPPQEPSGGGDAG